MVERHTPWATAAPVPRIPTPSTDPARDWFGNRHLRNPWQVSFFEEEPYEQARTNQLIGRTEDTIGDFARLFVICYTDAHPAWHYEVTDGQAQLHPLRTDTPSGLLTPRPQRPPLGIRRKEKPS